MAARRLRKVHPACRVTHRLQRHWDSWHDHQSWLSDNPTFRGMRSVFCRHFPATRACSTFTATRRRRRASPDGTTTRTYSTSSRALRSSVVVEAAPIAERADRRHADLWGTRRGRNISCLATTGEHRFTWTRYHSESHHSSLFHKTWKLRDGVRAQWLTQRSVSR